MKKILTILLIFYAASALCQAGEKNSIECSSLNGNIFLSQPFYAPGDTVFYSAYLRTEKGTPYKERAILDINLYSSTGQQLIKQKTLAVDGVAASKIVLPENLPSGTYQVNLTYYESGRTINICNSRTAFTIGLPISVDRIPLTFYSQGDLTPGVTTKLEITGPANVKGQIIKIDRTPIQTFSLDESGFGFVHFTPKELTTYYATIDSLEQKFSLPEILPDGISMLITPRPEDGVVRATLQIAASSFLRNKTLVISLNDNGRTYSNARVTFYDETSISVNLPTVDAYGDCSVVISHEDSLLIERNINLDNDLMGSIKLLKTSYNTRETVDVDIAVTDKHQQPVEGIFSIRVYKNDFKEFQSKNTIRAHAYNAATSSSVKNNERIVSPLLPSRIMKLNGKAVFKSTKVPVPELTRLTFYFQKNVMSYQAYCSTTGEFEVFVLLDFFGTENVFVQAELNGVSLPDVSVTLDDDHIASPDFPELKTDDPYITFQKKKKIIDDSFHYFTNNKTQKVAIATDRLLEEEVMGYDVSIKLDDYLRFETLQETIHEVIPMMQYRKSGTGGIVRVFCDELDNFFKDPPIFIIDGIMTSDMNQFLSLKATDVAAIKIIHTREKLKTFGQIGKGGVVVVDTKLPDDEKSVYDENTISVTGLQPREAQPILVTIQPPLTPDLRSNLIWSPLIRTDSNGKASLRFLTSDVTGSYMVEVTGYSNDGQYIQSTRNFTVSFDSSFK